MNLTPDDNENRLPVTKAKIPRLPENDVSTNYKQYHLIALEETVSIVRNHWYRYSWVL